MTDNPEKTRIPKITIRVLLREAFAFALWAYLVVKIFVFDFDVYFVETYLPSVSWLVRFKFFLFLVLTAIYWLSVGDKNFLKSLGFILAYPFIVLFWRMPKLFVGNWFAVLAGVGFGVSFFKSFKRNFLIFTVIALSTVLVIFTEDPLLLASAIVALSLFLVVHFLRRFYLSFVPSKALFLPKQATLELIEKSKNNLRLPEDLRSTAVEKFNAEQHQKWSMSLQTLLILNRFSHFAASKLREFQESRLVILYFLFGLIFSFFLTVFIFALNNYALHKLDPTAFSDPSEKNLFYFLYYSLNTILSGNIADFYPISTIARLLSTAELVFGFFLLVVLFFVFTNVKSDKTKAEVDSLISVLDSQGKELETVITQDFSMDLQAAIQVVEALPGSLLKIFYLITTTRKQRRKGAT